MTYLRVSSVKPTADIISGIVNCVCPECGGSMGGHGKEFKCQGRCQKNWRQIWDEHAGARLRERSSKKRLLKQ